MTGFLNLTEVASKRKTMIPIFWNHGLNLMRLGNPQSFFYFDFGNRDKIYMVSLRHSIIERVADSSLSTA